MTRRSKIPLLVALVLAIILFCSSDPDPPKQQSPQSQVVYVTNSGEKYHLEDCQHLRKSKIEIDKDDAIAQGFEACRVCEP